MSKDERAMKLQKAKMEVRVEDALQNVSTIKCMMGKETALRELLEKRVNMSELELG